MTAVPPRSSSISPAAPTANASRLVELAVLFLRLGLTAFGGPAAHIALMEREVVQRRRWIAPERFLDLLGAANLIPGPSSSELAIFIGYEQAGYAGLAVAGGCFILPAALITGALAWAYVAFGSLPRVSGVLYGIKPVIIAVVVQAIAALAPKAVKNRALAAVGVAALAGSALGLDVLAVLLAGGLLAALLRFARPWGANGVMVPAPVAIGPAVIGAAAGKATLVGIFGFFLKVGALVFGSGYVLLAFLRADLVDRWHWLTESQLLDAVTVGQMTPGPVFTTATFVGYLLGGVPGAVVATVGIFLPGFVFVAATRPLLARVRRSEVAGAFLDGVNVASMALMVVVTLQLSRAALVDAATVAMALASALLLVVWRVSSTWLIVAGAVLGALVSR
jgi:chromate transporter